MTSAVLIDSDREVVLPLLVMPRKCVSDATANTVAAKVSAEKFLLFKQNFKGVAMQSNNHPGGTFARKSLTQMLDRSARIKGVMDQCANELTSVNTVLTRQLADDVGLSEVRNALERTKSVGGKVQDVAEQLSEMNQVLEGEVKERELLERQLTVIKAREKVARYAAFHDPLTGLPNRVLFNDRLEHAVAQAKRHSRHFAVMFIDLDDFKKINDLYGHAIGDRVLQTIAQRLKYAFRDDDTVSRQGGDEFLSLLMEISDESALTGIAEKIINAIELPCEIGAGTIPVFPRISASIGIAVFPKDGMKAEDLVKSADAAMYSAKHNKTKRAFARPAHRGSGSTAVTTEPVF